MKLATMSAVIRMSKEVRCIMFTAEDTLSALGAVLGRKWPGFDPYSITKIDLVKEDAKVIARVAAPTEDGRTETVLDSDEVMAMMLMHCRTRRIPLSNRAVKHVELSEGRLVLVMSMNLEFVDPVVVPGAVIYAPTADKDFMSTSQHRL